MKTLHLVPSYSAAASLRLAVQATGRTDEVLGCVDDLSCGPILPDDLVVRISWWGEAWGGDAAEQLTNFWNCVATSNDRLVIWFGRHSSMEMAFLLAVANRLQDRHYCTVDVTGAVYSYTLRNGTSGISRPAQAASAIVPDGLVPLLDIELPAGPDFKHNACAKWRKLQTENAPFRIVSETGLVSAPGTYFDASILAFVTPEWQKMARVIGNSFESNVEPYYQVSDTMLHERMIALIDAGTVIADGNPCDMRACRVRLPGAP